MLTVESTTSTSTRVLAAISKAPSPVRLNQLKNDTGLSSSELAEATASLASRNEITWVDNLGWRSTKMDAADIHG